MKYEYSLFGKLFLVIVVIYSTNILAQSEKDALNKNELIKNSWQAVFGEMNMEDLKTISVESYFHGRKTPSKIIIKRSILFRNEFSKEILIFDGKRAMMVKEGENELID